MPAGTSEKGKATADKRKNTISFEKQEKPPIKRRRYTYTPMTFYWIKDLFRKLASHKNFGDAIAITFACLSMALAFPFYPYQILAILLVAAFVLTIYSPLIGLIVLLGETFPMVAYQTPLLAWFMGIFVAVSLFLGYKHYRTITFTYVLIMLPFSILGSFLEIPIFVLGVLAIGLKRGMAMTAVTLLLVAIISGLTGMQNTAPIAFNASLAHSQLSGSYVAYYVPSKNITTLSTFLPSFASSYGTLFSINVISQDLNIFVDWLIVLVSGINLILISLQILVWLVTIFVITNYVTKSRSYYKGAEASVFSFVLLAAFVVFSYAAGLTVNPMIIFGFLITPVVLLVLEYNNVNIVQVLDVVKRDFIEKFGEDIEELTLTRETFDDIANYEQTKKELKNAVLDPIEKRDIAEAYRIQPPKGLLFFGPPGTGKTLMMRALSNEVRAKFFYVKSSNIESPFHGEGSKKITEIFKRVSNNSPAVLFFDEIDAIAGKRENMGDMISNELLSTMLQEMDGFIRTKGVVIVGSTNVPQLLDPSIMRPGRFDKIIYMPLPDKSGREKIFKIYLKKLPIEKDIDYDKLASLTERFSGADIKAICEDTAREVSEDASNQSKILAITNEDLIATIKSRKPSTSLRQIAEYEKFKYDYERRVHPEDTAKEAGAISIDDVVGLEDAKKALYDAVQVPLQRPDLVSKYKIKDIRGILMFGPPGCGKTLLMKAVLSQISDVKMISVSGAELTEGGYDQYLARIKETFDRARENAPCIIFIDEIDALTPSRKGASELTSQVISQFLQEMDGIRSSKGIVVVGATNLPERIDPALLRSGRFEKLIFVHPPEKEDRELLFKKNLEGVPKAEDIDYEKIAEMTNGYTPADISKVCNIAKTEAMESEINDSEEYSVSMDSITKALGKVKPSAGHDVIEKYAEFLFKHGDN